MFKVSEKLYSVQSKQWPVSGPHISGSFDSDSIVVYQAYNPTIATAAATHQNFIDNNEMYNPTRMTWFKPNFLWMMYRSGWATKLNQDAVLAIRVRRSWLEQVLCEAALSGGPKLCKSARAVVQWDPDHSPDGAKHPHRRDLQVGIRGSLAVEWSQGNRGPAIVEITDITGYVRNAHFLWRSEGDFPRPAEVVYDAPPAVRENLEMDV